MRSDGLFKILGLGFLLALMLYIVSFKWIQHQREYKGPWRVVFSSDNSSIPYLLVSQSTLKIEDHKITFENQKAPRPNLARVVYFNNPTTNAPFGEIVFQDPTFLPGTITFNFWGHEVELMPRTLIIDKKEIPWHSDTNIVVSGEGKFQRKPVKKPAIL